MSSNQSDLAGNEASLAQRMVEYFGAHQVPQRDEHERERAIQRVWVTAAILAAWSIELAGGEHLSALRIAWIVFCAVYGSASYLHIRNIRLRPGSGVAYQYLFLLLDPMALVALLAEDKNFAFLNPFVMVVIVRCGLRYGIRTMWLCWGVALVATATSLPLSNFWSTQRELAFSFLLTLAFVPIFFPTLIRRIHNVRALEEERARVGAMQEVVSVRSAFLSKVSHELRSPLQSIVSALDVFEMRHGHGIAEDDELIGRMRRSSMLLNTQLRDLLTLARGQSGRLALHPEPFEVLSLVEGVIIAAREAAKEKGLVLKMELPPEPIFAVADGARIDQVLTNLVVNSVRYTHAGEVRVTLYPFDRDRKHLRFTISDTGPGIPAAVLPTLFEPDKLLTSGERKGEGSGIGLAVVRTLVDHLGGTVTVDSGEGRGTTFELQIPAELIDSRDPDGNSHEDTDRILIVDDREDVLTGLTSVINQLGYACDRASTAAAAANLLAIRRYHAVLLDIQMPTKSGPDIATETRRGNGPNRETRLIGMSAAEVTAQYAAGPFDACLTKPIDRTALISALREEWPESWPSSTI